MSYIVDNIVNTIYNQEIEKAEKAMYRIEGIDDIKIYEAVCKKVSERALKKGIDLTIKLSLDKYNDMKQNMKDDEQAAFLSMDSNNWVGDGDCLTNYRNYVSEDERPVLIVLLGTDMIEDRGGLADCSYLISPTTICEGVNNKYSEFFNCEHLDSDEKKLIDDLYIYLFKEVSVNIFKIDRFASSLLAGYDIDEFVEAFFLDLRSYGLPKMCNMYLYRFELEKKMKTIFLDAAKFIKRKADYFGGTEKKIKKIEENIDNCIKSQEYSDEDFSDQGVSSQEELKEVLMKYVKGIDIDICREKLINTDFNIVKYFLKEKKKDDNKDETDKKESTFRVSDEPLVAILKIILDAIKANEKDMDYLDIDKVLIRVDEIKVSKQIELKGEEEKELLADAYKKIAIAIGDITTYIDNYRLKYGENELKIELSNKGVFVPEFVDEYIENSTITTTTNKNKIKFTVTLFSNNKKCGKVKKAEWAFSQTEQWLLGFADIVKELENGNHSNSFIPFATFSEIDSLNEIRSSEEFFDMAAGFNLDYMNVLDTISDISDSQIATEIEESFNEIGINFCKYISKISSSGFYSAFGEARILIDSYIQIGKKLNEKQVGSSLINFVRAYVHAFAIEKSMQYVERLESDMFLIPPYHPAALEKMIEKSDFIMNGFKDYLLNYSSQLEEKELDRLNNLSQICSAVDAMPVDQKQYIAANRTYGNYSILSYNSRNNKDDNVKLNDLIKKEMLSADDAKEAEYKKGSQASILISDTLEDYANAFKYTRNTLNIAVIDPLDLQPVVAALYKYIEYIKKANKTQNTIDIRLDIIVDANNRGGESYLSYFVETCFSEEDGVNVKVYFNQYNRVDEIEGLIKNNTDIVFVMNMFKESYIDYKREEYFDGKVVNSKCTVKYPMVYNNLLCNKTEKAREIVITQPQFEAATMHSRIVYKYHNADEDAVNKLAIRRVSIDNEKLKVVDSFHMKAYWVVCVDMGMDGAVLRSDKSENYKIIGFSTGKGDNAQYNITITARSTLVEIIRKKFEHRIRTLFNWTDGNKAYEVSKYCVKEAEELDGVKLLRAINTKDRNINEFMAYILTSLQLKNEISNEKLSILINADSYKHWFVKGGSNTNRPDFIHFTVYIDENDKLKIEANVIECKIAKEANENRHIEKALMQVSHSIDLLTNIFMGDDQTENRYWYAQIYRALVFAQITFDDDNEKFKRMQEKLRLILEGDFSISFTGTVYGYFIDKYGDTDDITIESVDEKLIEVRRIPQIRIKKILTGYNEDSDESYETIPSYIDDDANEVFDMDSDTYEDEIPLEEETTDIEALEEELTAKSKTEEVLSVKTDLEKVNEEDNSEKIEVEGEIADNSAKVDDMDKEKDVRVMLGKDRAGKEIFWEFNSSNMGNRHLLITGTSGQGKSYCIQTMLYELMREGVSSAVFDYSDSFTTEKLEKKFTELADNKIKQKIIYNEGVPINPFKRHDKSISGLMLKEKPGQVALRLSSILSNVYSFGDRQKGEIYDACVEGMEKYGDEMDMKKLADILSNGSSQAKSVVSKIRPFVDEVEFNSTEKFDWSQITEGDGTITVFQLCGFVRDIQIIITELMLWDAWHYNQMHGDKNKPFVVVLDEAQNLSHKDGSPSESILREGRKYGWSAWYVTQTTEQLRKDELLNLQQAAFRINFKPADKEVVGIAKMIDNDNQRWINTLKNLEKGHCVISGPRLRPDGIVGPAKAIEIKVTSFEERVDK